MSEHLRRQSAPPSASGSAGRWAVSTMLVVSLATAGLLLWSGSASGASVGAPGSAPSPAVHLLGLPLGAAVWLLLGAAGLLVGLAAVGRSRRARTNPTRARANPTGVARANPTGVARHGEPSDEPTTDVVKAG